MFLMLKFPVKDNVLDIHAKAPNFNLKEGSLVLVMHECADYSMKDPYTRKIHTKADYDHYVETNRKIAKEYGADIDKGTDLDKVPADKWVGFLEEDNHRIHVTLKDGEAWIIFRTEDVVGEQDRDMERMQEYISRDLLYAMDWAIEDNRAHPPQAILYSGIEGRIKDSIQRTMVQDEVKRRTKKIMEYIRKEMWML